MKIVFLLAVFWIQRYVVIGAIPNCCTSKNVGGLEYTLLRVEDTSQHKCLTNCVYEKVGEPVPGRTYCFGAGDLKVECTGEGDPIICDDELKTLHGLLSASNNTNDIHCCENGMTTSQTTCGNGTDCATVCGVIPTCAKVVTDPEAGKDHCSNSKTNTRDGRANNIDQVVIMKTSASNGPNNLETTGGQIVCDEYYMKELISNVSASSIPVQCCREGLITSLNSCSDILCAKLLTTGATCSCNEGDNHKCHPDWGPDSCATYCTTECCDSGHVCCFAENCARNCPWFCCAYGHVCCAETPA